MGATCPLLKEPISPWSFSTQYMYVQTITIYMHKFTSGKVQCRLHVTIGLSLIQKKWDQRLFRSALVNVCTVSMKSGSISIYSTSK